MKPYYEHGGITIYHGDCREILPTLAADVLVTDPPYGVSYRSNWSKHKDIAGDGDHLVRDEVLALWGDRPTIVFGSWKIVRPASVRARLIWSKAPDPGMGDLTMPWGMSDEEIYVMGDGFTGRRGPNVLAFPKVPVGAKGIGRDHPSPKPRALMVHLIERCPPGTILDPFMGSGTTLRAAKDLHRNAIGIELEERYCEIAANRLRQNVLPMGEAQ